MSDMKKVYDDITIINLYHTAKKELRAYFPNIYTVVQAQYSKGLTAN